MQKHEAPFSKIILSILGSLRLGRAKSLYIKSLSFWNYAFVCGVGVGINMLAFSFYLPLLGPHVSNFLAIITAWLFNWTFSVGPLGWIFGLSEGGKWK